MYPLVYEPSRPLDGTFRRIRIEPKDRNFRRHRAGYLGQPQR
jgi:hypothetical protein